MASNPTETGLGECIVHRRSSERIAYTNRNLLCQVDMFHNRYEKINGSISRFVLTMLEALIPLVSRWADAGLTREG